MFTGGAKTKMISMALVLMLLALPLTGCSHATTDSAAADTSSSTAILVEFDSEDLDSSWNETQATRIILQGDSISVDGEGAAAQGDTVTIGSGGTYVITGTLNDGQILVDSQDKAAVKLVLKGSEITSLNNAPIYVKSAAKTILTLAKGTENVITDGNEYILEDASTDEPDAAVFSQDDLTINGTGFLVINANYQHGINSKDDLKIAAGNLTVNAAADGIKGKDMIAIRDVSLVLTAGSDGLQSNNDADPSKGFVYIENGALQITSGNDGIQAATSVLIKDGDLKIISGGGNVNGKSQISEPMPVQRLQPGADPAATASTNTSAETETESYKGIKAGVDITIDNGQIALDTADDAIHSNDSVVINAGNISISSGDDGIHSDTTMKLNGGNVTIDKSYEAIESASITINGGSFRLTARDDGINTAGGNDSSSVNGRAAQNNFDASDGSQLIINGGYIYVDAQGDGIDVNGDFTMTNGKVIVNGPTSNGNGALDYNGSFVMNGGTLIAAGSSGMAMAPGEESQQASLMLNLGNQPAGTLICIQDKAGESILTFAPGKDFASVMISSPQIAEGNTYTVYTGGSSTSTAADGLYSDSDYTPGTKVTSITTSGTVTTYGQTGGGMHGAGRPGSPGEFGGSMTNR